MNYTALLWGFTLLMGAAMLALPRQWAVAPFLLGIFVLPVSETFVIAGLNFPSTRILILIGVLGLGIKAVSSGIRLNSIDKAILGWVTAAVIAHSLLWGTSAALINRLGYGFDILGTYLIVRCLIRDFEDLERTVTVLAVILVFIAAAMFIEKMTSRNLFAVFGGVPAVPELRKGRLRCQGPFRHPIMAGIFGASSFPLCLGLYWIGRKWKVLGVCGAVAASVITITSASSGPLSAYFAGILALLMWPLRGFMRAIRWGFLSVVVLLELVMKADVWDLIGRVGIVDGATAYHRAVIIDAFIHRFSEWWLFGTRTTAHWAPKFLVPTDLTNQFVRIGVDGGIVTLGLFVGVISLSFAVLGRARKVAGLRLGMQRMCWAMGCALFVHVVAFMGASYWDQVIYALYATFALIGAVASMKLAAPSPSTATIDVAPAETWFGTDISKPIGSVSRWQP